MKAEIITSTMSYVISKAGGKTTCTISATLYEGYVEAKEGSRTIKRLRLGTRMEIGKTASRKSASQFIKQCQKAGDIVVLEGDFKPVI